MSEHSDNAATDDLGSGGRPDGAPAAPSPHRVQLDDDTMSLVRTLRAMGIPMSQEEGEQRRARSGGAR